MARPSKITDEAVEAAAEWLARRWTKSTIKKALARRFEIDCARTQERVLARARELLRANLQRPLHEVLADTVAYLEAVMRSPDAQLERYDDPNNPDKKITALKGVTQRDKLRAVEQLVKVLGLGPQANEPEGERVIKFRPVGGGGATRADDEHADGGGGS